MSATDNIPLDAEMQKLESQVSDLVGLCQRLRRENHNLRDGQRLLTKQNSVLSEKTRLARTRIESIIGRLKTLETGH